jgi:hypothetical protein
MMTRREPGLASCHLALLLLRLFWRLQAPHTLLSKTSQPVVEQCRQSMGRRGMCS